MATTESTGVEQSHSTGIPWRSPTLLVVLTATLMTPMDVPMISPALPEIQSAFGLSESGAGLFITLYALPGILLAPLIGALADRIGRRYVLSTCLAVFGVAGTAIAFTGDVRVALGLRVVQGFTAGGVIGSLAMTVVGDSYTGRRHDAVMGVTAATLSVGTAIYPLVGGYLAAHAWNAPFLVYALAVPVAVLVLVVLEDPDTDHGSNDGSYVRDALRTIPTRRALALYGVMFLSFTLLFGGVYTALPFYLAGSFGFASTTVGLVTSAMLVVSAAVATQNGRLAARASRTELLAAGFALFAAGLVGVSLATLPSLGVGLLAFGVGSGLVTPTLFAGISSLAPDRVRAGVMSLQTTTIGASQTVGPALFTLLGGAVGYQLTLFGAGLWAVLCVVLIALVPLDS